MADTLTANFSLVKIEPGTTGWDVKTNNNLDLLDSILSGFSFRGALAWTNNVSIPNSVATVLPFNQEEYDTDTIHDTAVNNSRLTVPTGAEYVRLTASIQRASGATGYWQIVLLKNGSSSYVGVTQELHPAEGTPGSSRNLVSPVLAVTPGDYFELRLFQSTGVSANASGWFCMEVIQ